MAVCQFDKSQCRGARIDDVKSGADVAVGQGAGQLRAEQILGHAC